MTRPAPTRPRALTALAVAAIAIGTAACRTDASPTTASGAAEHGGESGDVERVRIGGILWYVDYDAALAVAREQDKAMWVHFGENPG